MVYSLVFLEFIILRYLLINLYSHIGVILLIGIVLYLNVSAGKIVI